MRVIILLICISLHQSCLDFGGKGDLELDSKEAQEMLSSSLSVNDIKEIYNLHFYYDESGIDPFFFSKFNCPESSFNSIKIDWEIDSISNSKPINSPKWYNINDTKHLISYSKKGAGFNSYLFYNKENQEVFFQYSTY